MDIKPLVNPSKATGVATFDVSSSVVNDTVDQIVGCISLGGVKSGTNAHVGNLSTKFRRLFFSPRTHVQGLH